MGTLRGVEMLSAAIAMLLASAHLAICNAECASSLDDHLLLAEENTIWDVNANSGNRNTLWKSPSVISMDYNYEKNTLYWADMKSRQIYALKDKSSKAKVVIPSEDNWLPKSISLDPVSDKVYVADIVSDTVHVFDLDNNNHGIIVGTNLSSVTDVEVDPYERYLFVLDKYQILRTDLDGSDKRVLLAEYGNIDDIYSQFPLSLQGIFQQPHQQRDGDSKIYSKPLSISDLTLDVKAKRIYWVNSLTRKIESMNYNGQDRKVHFQEDSGNKVYESLASLAILNGKLYWADDITQKVCKVDASDGNKNQVILKNVQPQYIKAIDCSSYHQTLNPCASNNGQCQQLCLLSRSSTKEYSCACSIGYQLGQDGKSCNAVQEFVLFEEDQQLRGQSLSADGKLSIDVIDPAKYQAGSVMGLDFNALDGQIFYSSLFPNNKLHQIDLSSGLNKILEPDLLSKNVGVLAFDWTTKNLYYFTYYFADMTSLSVTNVQNPTYSKILVNNVDRLVRGIALHPNRGFVYFSQLKDDRSLISRMAMDGSGLTILIDLKHQDSIDGLTIDYEEDRLYWSESTRNSYDAWSTQIRHSNLNGTDIRDLVLPKNMKRPSELSIKGDYIFLLAGPGKTLIRMNKKTGELTILRDTKTVGTIHGVKIYSQASQVVKADHPCSNGHQCQKFCFAVPYLNDDLKGVCGCPYGEKLAEDGRSCVDNSKQKPPFKPCKFTSLKCNKTTEAV